MMARNRHNRWISSSPLLDVRPPLDLAKTRTKQGKHYPVQSNDVTRSRTCWYPGCEVLVEDDDAWRKYVGLCEKCYRRVSSVAKGHGITASQYRALFMRQNRACGGCQREFAADRKPHVDHCHDSGLVRGLLCSSCNTGLGQLGDNAEGLRRLIKYLSRAQVLHSGKEPPWRLDGRPQPLESN